MKYKNEISISDLINLITAISTIAAAIFAVISFRADHIRRKKQATIEQMSAIRAEYRRKKEDLIGDKKQLTMEEAQRINANRKKREDLDDLLSLFEHLATGVNTDVFDLLLINRISGQYLIDVFETCQSYIEIIRKEANEEGSNAKYFEEFYSMINKIKEIRGEEPIKLPY